MKGGWKAKEIEIRNEAEEGLQQRFEEKLVKAHAGFKTEVQKVTG